MITGLFSTYKRNTKIPKLESLEVVNMENLSYNKFWQFATGITHLTVERVHPSRFIGCKGLKILTMSINKMNYVSGSLAAVRNNSENLQRLLVSSYEDQIITMFLLEMDYKFSFEITKKEDNKDFKYIVFEVESKSMRTNNLEYFHLILLSTSNIHILEILDNEIKESHDVVDLIEKFKNLQEFRIDIFKMDDLLPYFKRSITLAYEKWDSVPLKKFTLNLRYTETKPRKFFLHLPCNEDLEVDFRPKTPNKNIDRIIITRK